MENFGQLFIEFLSGKRDKSYTHCRNGPERKHQTSQVEKLNFDNRLVEFDCRR